MAIVVHFPLLNVPTPANVQVVNNFLVPIVTFELLDTAFTTELVYDFDDEKQILLQPLAGHSRKTSRLGKNLVDY